MAPARIQVTPAAVAAYLRANITERLYATFYGLHLLSDAQFQQVWDALLNGDCQPEELVRLGAFTDAEVTSFVNDVLGDWVNPGVATPAFGTSGYAYLTATLGLTANLQADAANAVTVPGPDPGAFLGVRVSAGLPGGAYESAAAVDLVFQEQVLPAALGASPYGALLPQSPADVAQYVSGPGSTPGAASLAAAWYGGIYAPLYGVPAAQLGSRLLCVNEDPTLPLLENPGLAQYLLSEPEVPQAFRLLLMREAAVRTAEGPYTKPQAAAQIAALQALAPSPVATSRAMAHAYLWAAILPAACAESLASLPGDPDWSSYAPQAADIASAYALLQAYRLRLRGFLLAVYQASIANIQGTYPPG